MDLARRVSGGGSKATLSLEVIKTMVAQTTDPVNSPPPEAEKNLVAALSNPATVNIVYECIIERLSSEASQSMTVLLRGTTLLKTHIQKYQPTTLEVLARMDRFCQRTLTGDGKMVNPTIQKSLTYIRTLVTKQVAAMGDDAMERWNGIKIALNMSERPISTASERKSVGSISTAGGGVAPSPATVAPTVTVAAAASTTSSTPSTMQHQHQHQHAASALPPTITSVASVATRSAVPTPIPPATGGSGSVRTATTSTAAQSILLSASASLRREISNGGSASIGSAVAPPKQQPVVPHLLPSGVGVSGVKALDMSLLRSPPPPPLGTVHAHGSLSDFAAFGGHFKSPSTGTPQDAQQHQYQLDAGSVPQGIAAVIEARKMRRAKQQQQGGTVVVTAKRSTTSGGTVSGAGMLRLGLGLGTMRGSGGGVPFQYKHYCDQRPLVLSHTEIDQVMQSLLGSVDTEEGRRSRIVASGQLIKVMCDTYASGNAAAIAALLCPLLELLSSASAAVRCHAYSLLFNLSVHLNMLDASFSAFGGDTDTAGSTGGGERTALAPSPRVTRAQVDVLGHKLGGMLRHTVLSEEADGCVWACAAKCLIALAWDRGAPRGDADTRAAVGGIDPRAYVCMLRHMDDEAVDAHTHRAIVYLLVSSLYDDASRPTRLNLAKLEALGGLPLVLDLLSCAPCVTAVGGGGASDGWSAVGRRTLFVVVFDYVINVLATTKQMDVSGDQLSSLCELLHCVSDVPQHLGHPLRCMPDRFVEAFVKHLCLDLLAKQRPPSLARSMSLSGAAPTPTGGSASAAVGGLKSRVDKGLVVAFMYELEKACARYSKMEVEFEDRMQQMASVPLSADGHCRLLRSLLTSTDPTERRNGETWLFHLLRQREEGGSGSGGVWECGDRLYAELCGSADPSVRRTVYGAAQRLLLHAKGKAGGASAAEVMRVFAERFACVAKEKGVGETDVRNLTYVANVLFEVTVPWPTHADGSEDSLPEMLLAGRSTVPSHMHGLLPAAIILHVYTQLAKSPLAACRSSSVSYVRAALLHLLCLSYACSDISTARLAFFRTQMDDPNPLIACVGMLSAVQLLKRADGPKYQSLLSEAASKQQQNAFLVAKEVLSTAQLK